MSHHRKDAMPTHRSLFLLFLLIPLACLMQAAPARANSYAYAVCTGPHGEPNYSTEGWQPAKQSIGAQAYFTCSGGGGLNLGFAGSSAYGEGDYGAMTFTAPADIVVDGATYLRQTQGIAACSSAGCAKSSELLHYDVKLDALSSETCSPFAHNASGTSSCPNGLSGRYHLGGYSARTLTFRVQCGYSGSGGCAEGSGVPRATISALEVQLRDESNPQATSVTGALAGTGTHAGTEQLHVEASDKGSGVQLIRLFVDGKTVVSQIIDPNTVDGVDRCTQAEHHIYRVPMPCKDHAGVNLVLDTTSLKDGKHSLVVGIDDAASNYTQAMNNADFEVRNHPAVASGPTGTSGASGGAGGGSSTGTTGGSGAGSGGGSGAGGAGGTGGAGAGGPGGAGGAGGTGGGTGASTTTPGATVTPGSGLGTLPGGTAGGVPTVVDLPLAKGVANGINATANAVLTAAFVKSGGSALTTRYGQRAVVRGSLTSPDGTAIAGARVELSSRIAMPGAVSIDKGGARTRSDGSWTIILPSDVSSRSLSFGYRPVVGEGPLVTQQSLVLQVKAGARLRVTPGTAHNGSTLTFTGLLKGKPIPRAGKVVELQARGKGGRQWITFLAPRASVTGRFTARYRLKNTNGPVTYQFRAVIRRESAYPFLAGTSPVRSVRVR